MANMTIHQSPVDWDLVAGNFEKHLNNGSTRMARMLSGFISPSPKFYREWRTIALGGGRQNGKTAWCIDKALKLGPTALILTINKNYQKEIIDKMVQAGVRGQKLPTVLTMKYFLSIYNVDSQPGHQWMKYKKIFVDDSTFIFERFKRNMFYDAVLNAAESESLIYMMN